MNSKLNPICIIHSPYYTKEVSPIQGALCPDGMEKVEIFNVTECMAH